MKALALLSGGLDSGLAARLIKDQGVEVIGLVFSTPFANPNKKLIKKLKEKLKIKILEINLGKEYINLVRKPKYGYGKNINPCIDCKILFLKKAKSLMKKLNAKFVITGEVLGQRPMSQNYSALKLIEEKSGLKGKLLRPLSAKLLPITEAEKRNWVNREKLLNIQGRSRKIQLEFAKKYNLPHSAPAGGCLLTDPNFSIRLFDLLNHKKIIAERDVELLKLGRHFRIKSSKIIVGRNYEENKKLLKLKSKGEIILEVKEAPGPTTLLQGKEIKKAAELTMRYSDVDEGIVEYNKKEIKVKSISEKEIKKYRI